MSLKPYTATTQGASARGKSIVIAQAAYLRRVWGINKAAATRYIHFLNVAALPANGAVTHKLSPLEVGAGQMFSVDLSDDPELFSVGICIYGSSTENDKTIVVADDLIMTLCYSKYVQ